MQKVLTKANKLPELALLKEFMQSNEDIKTGVMNTRRNLKKYIKDQVSLQK